MEQLLRAFVRPRTGGRPSFVLLSLRSRYVCLCSTIICSTIYSAVCSAMCSAVCSTMCSTMCSTICSTICSIDHVFFHPVKGQNSGEFNGCALVSMCE